MNTPEAIVKRSETLTGRQLPEDHKAKRIGKHRTKAQKVASNKCKTDLKSRWSDPIWKANQIERLKEGAKRRWSISS